MRPHFRLLSGCLPAVVSALLAAVLPLAASAAPAAASAGSGGGGVVVEGRPVPIGDSPWMVALASRSLFGDTRSGQFCGGVLVAERTVVTVAHCMGADTLGRDVAQVSDLRAVVGRGDLTGSSGQEIEISRVWVNPEYDSWTNAGDLAVLTLAERATAGSAIPMASAPDDPGYRPGTRATVYGWGDTTGRGDYATSLRAADVQVLPDATCEQAYPGSQDGTYLARHMLCAGEEAGGPDACQGDSGGSLVAEGRLVGLVSWGTGCGQAGNPGVYTRMSAVADLVKQRTN